MANKVQKNWKLTYFQHDVTRGKTVSILRSRFGNDGFAFWFGLLELLGGSEGAYIDLSDVGALEYLSSWCGVTDEQALEMLDLLSDLRAIDGDLYRNDNKIWCQKFVDRMNHLHKRRKYTPTKPGVDEVSEKDEHPKFIKKAVVKKAFEPDFKALAKSHPRFDAEKAFARFKEWNEEHDKPLLKMNWETWMQRDIESGKHKKPLDPNRMIKLECPACGSTVGVKWSDRSSGVFCKDKNCEMQMAYGQTLVNERAYYKKQAK